MFSLIVQEDNQIILINKYKEEFLFGVINYISSPWYDKNDI